jgi:membrane associated rhomboid family serine protease
VVATHHPFLQLAIKNQVPLWYPHLASLVLTKIGAHAALQDNQLIRAGEWWRFITPVALHANFLHLAINNKALDNLGPLVENLSGPSPRSLVRPPASSSTPAPPWAPPVSARVVIPCSFLLRRTPVCLFVTVSALAGSAASFFFNSSPSVGASSARAISTVRASCAERHLFH